MGFIGDNIKRTAVLNLGCLLLNGMKVVLGTDFPRHVASPHEVFGNTGKVSCYFCPCVDLLFAV